MKTGEILTPINKNSIEYNLILKNLQNQKNIKRLLDMGCRDGQFTELIGQTIKGVKLYGVDIEKKAIGLAIKRGIKAKCVDIEKEKFPYPNNYFDSIVCLDVIEHVFDKDHAIEEVYRVLKPNGTLILSTPNLASWINRILLFIGIEPILQSASTKHYLGIKYSNDLPSPPDHINLFSFGALKKFIKIYNFQIVKIIGCSYFIKRFFLLSLFERILFKIFPSLSDNLIIIAKCKK